MIIFDGNAFAQEKEEQLKPRVKTLREMGHIPKISAILFSEDKGSTLYTGLKQQAAERVGISYDCHEFSLLTSVEKVLEKISDLNEDKTVTGIIIQKPWRARWQEVTQNSQEEFQQWWQSLVSYIYEKKDVDGLHPNTLFAIQKGIWKQQRRVLPATAKAVIEVLKQAQKDEFNFRKKEKIIILGKSDILGQPLFYELKNQGREVEMIGSKELAERQVSGDKLLDAEIIISSTGHHHLITGDMIHEGVIVIDVGEPKPDVDFASVSPKSSFITPVPGGVGPVTVASLLENCLDLFD